MTTKELITAIAGNLGNRAEGTIGGEAVDTVILRAINLAVPQCVKLANPTYYEETATLSLEDTNIFDYPTIDSKRIKDILNFRVTRSDGTPVTVVQKTFSEFVFCTADYEQAIEGTPSLLAFHNNKIYINRVPSETLTMILYCEVWPKEIATTGTSVALPIDAEWELAVEAYATHYCYLKLQQFTAAQYWLGLFNDQKLTNIQVKRKVNTRDGGAGTYLNNSALNPLVYSNR